MNPCLVLVALTILFFVTVFPLCFPEFCFVSLWFARCPSRFKMQGGLSFHHTRVFASDGPDKMVPFRAVIIYRVVVSTLGLLCAVHLGTLLQCAASLNFPR